jgi:hypothetical protein
MNFVSLFANRLLKLVECELALLDKGSGSRSGLLGDGLRDNRPYTEESTAEENPDLFLHVFDFLSAA